MKANTKSAAIVISFFMIGIFAAYLATQHFKHVMFGAAYDSPASKATGFIDSAEQKINGLLTFGSSGDACGCPSCCAVK